VLAATSMLIVAIGAGALYLPMAAMTEMAAEFGGRRQVPSGAYTLAYIGAGIGGIGMGWLADRLGPRGPVTIAAVMIGAGAWVAALGDGVIALFLGYGGLMGLLGHSGTFAPLVSNLTLWFDKHRGTAVAVLTCGHSLAGTVWPQVYRHLLPAYGWRRSLMIYGVFAMVTMLALSLTVRRPRQEATRATAAAKPPPLLPYPSWVVMTMLCLAILGCCMPMAIPVVHMVALCGDLGIAAERGTEAVSLLLFVALATSLIWGRITDRVGGLPTIFVLSGIQAVAIFVMQFIEHLPALYTISAVLGLAFIGTVQSYAVVLRQLYGDSQGAWRVGLVMSFGLLGMALGGWAGGAIYDWALSYQPAFLAGFVFNSLNLLCIGALLLRQPRRPSTATA
jgi:MFS family permease